MQPFGLFINSISVHPSTVVMYQMRGPPGTFYIMQKLYYPEVFFININIFSNEKKSAS